MNVKLTIASVLLLAAVDAQAWQGKVGSGSTTQTNTIGFRIGTSRAAARASTTARTCASARGCRAGRT